MIPNNGKMSEFLSKLKNLDEMPSITARVNPLPNFLPSVVEVIHCVESKRVSLPGNRRENHVELKPRHCDI